MIGRQALASRNERDVWTMPVAPARWAFHVSVVSARTAAKPETNLTSVAMAISDIHKSKEAKSGGFLPRHYVGVAVWSLAVAVVTLSVLAFLQWREPFRSRATNAIGGPFALVDQHGKSVTERDYLGKPFLVFFGFTYCPDICPTTLFEISTMLKEMGGDADRLNILFVTVDPDRDTPEQLALYLSSFDPHITGLSGPSQNIEAVMKEYHALARKVPLADGDYTMDHTAVVYMMNKDGRFVGPLNFEESEAAARLKLRRLVDSQPS